MRNLEVTRSGPGAFGRDLRAKRLGTGDHIDKPDDEPGKCASGDTPSDDIPVPGMRVIVDQSDSSPQQQSRAGPEQGGAEEHRRGIRLALAILNDLGAGAVKHAQQGNADDHRADRNVVAHRLPP